MANEKKRNALDYELMKRVLMEKGTEEQRKAFVKVAYGYCRTVEVICRNPKSDKYGQPVRSFEWITDEAQIAALRAAGKEPSYNKKAAEEWFKANFPEEVPHAKKPNTSSMWKLWGE